VLAALLGLIIGYLLGRSNCPKDTYKTGAIPDPHTADDGDCNDTEEADVSDSASATGATGAVDEADTVTQAEAQGLMQTDDASSVETEVAEDEATASEAASAAEEEASTSNDAASANGEADKETAGEDAEADSAPAEAEAAVAKDDSAEVASEEGDSEDPSDNDKPTTLLDAPRDGKKDNLTRIKGIGVKIDALLNSIGVYHFDQIAAWNEKEAKWIDHQVSFPGRAFRDDWIGQAKLLAEGKETEFSKRVDAGEVSSSKKS